ncbi:MAG: hypothetical protein AAFO01_01630 [Pseudomonadota bacterium]
MSELAKLPAECRGEAVEEMPNSFLKPLLDLFLDTVDHAEAKARDVRDEMSRREN